MPAILQYGWVCPRCDRIYSPMTPMCSYCLPPTPDPRSTVWWQNWDPTSTTAVSDFSVTISR